MASAGHKTVQQTTCTMDCPDTCTLQVTVEDGRVTTIDAGAGHPNTAGFICSKVAQFDKRLYHQDRLLYPQRRTGKKGAGEFARISWDEAIAEITEKFQAIQSRSGGEAILPYNYGGSNGMLTDGFLDALFFARLGASQLGRTLCAMPATLTATGIYGKMPGVAFEDYPAARCIIVWGANPKVSNIHLVPYLKEAKRNGAFIAVVDPRRNFSNIEIDLHLPVLPGGDLPLALGMICLWKESSRFDDEFITKHTTGSETLLAEAEQWPLDRAAKESGVPAEDIRKLADTYAGISPALIRIGWGLERNLNGGQAMAAILSLPALMGKFGVRGGGYTLSNNGGAKLDWVKLFDLSGHQTRTLNMTQLGVLLTGGLKPAIEALLVYNANPVASTPDQNQVRRGLEREDLFTVVHEQVMTDTARYADILLPATTFLEHHDIRVGYGSYVVGGTQPVIEPRGEALSNLELFARLGRAMGFADEAFQWDGPTCLQKAAEALQINGKAAGPERFSAGGAHLYDFPGPAPVQFGTVFPATDDGKANLNPSVLGPEPYCYHPVRSEKFPLALISPATSKMISSTLGEFNYPELKIVLHPSDATTRKVRSGDLVRVFNELGEVVCRAEISDRVRPGVASMPKGAWRKSSRNGQTAVALAPAHVSVVGGGACFNDARVEVERAPPDRFPKIPLGLYSISV